MVMAKNRRDDEKVPEVAIVEPVEASTGDIASVAPPLLPKRGVEEWRAYQVARFLHVSERTVWEWGKRIRMGETVTPKNSTAQLTYCRAGVNGVVFFDAVEVRMLKANIRTPHA